MMLGEVVKDQNIKESFFGRFFKNSGFEISSIAGKGNDIQVLSDYMYAIMFSRRYRSENADRLKNALPIIPYPKSKEYYISLARKGSQLRQLHVKGDVDFGSVNFHFDENENDSHVVGKYSFKADKIYINASSYFDIVSSESWGFYIGGYQPLQKWLKDRKGIKLTENDVIHYKKMISIIGATITLMDEIDEIY